MWNKNKFYDQLLKDTGFDKDPRVKFVGTVYNQELLKYIRENALLTSMAMKLVEQTHRF